MTPSYVGGKRIQSLLAGSRRHPLLVTWTLPWTAHATAARFPRDSNQREKQDGNYNILYILPSQFCQTLSIRENPVSRSRPQSRGVQGRSIKEFAYMLQPKLKSNIFSGLCKSKANISTSEDL
jgi:hypothetical protein